MRAHDKGTENEFVCSLSRFALKTNRAAISSISFRRNREAKPRPTVFVGDQPSPG